LPFLLLIRGRSKTRPCGEAKGNPFSERGGATHQHETRSPSAPRWISTPPPIDHAERGGTGATAVGWLGGGRSGPTRTPGSWRERGRAAVARVGRSGLELDGKRQHGKNSGWGSHLGGRGEQLRRGLCSGEEDLGRCVPLADRATG
jgi:hypothetical protein